RRKKAHARERRLRAELAVQLDRMAARLVDLQRHLATVEDHRRRTRLLRFRAKQRGGLFRRALGVAREVVALDELPAFRALVPANAVRVRAVLHFALVDGRRLDATTRLVQLLLDVRAFRAREGLVLALPVEIALG